MNQIYGVIRVIHSLSDKKWGSRLYFYTARGELIIDSILRIMFELCSLYNLLSSFIPYQ